MKHTATLKEHELTWNMMNQVWEFSGIIEAGGEEYEFYGPLTNYPSVLFLRLYEENQQLKELLKECRVYVENCEQFNAYDFEMLKTIDNVIGENK